MSLLVKHLLSPIPKLTINLKDFTLSVGEKTTNVGKSRIALLLAIKHAIPQQKDDIAKELCRCPRTGHAPKTCGCAWGANLDVALLELFQAGVWILVEGGAILLLHDFHEIEVIGTLDDLK